MRRLPLIKLFVIAIIAWVMPIHAANIQPFIMDSNHFYDMSPGQRPLSEQFASIVNSPPNPLNIAQRRPVSVAILLFGSVQSVKNHSLLTAFKRRMKELKIDYKLETFFGKHNQYDAAEYNKLNQARPDYLIVTDLDLVQSRYVEQILRENHTKVMFYDMSTPLTNWQNHSPFMYLGFDQKKVVDTLASYLHRQLPATANIAAFVVDSSYLGDRRCNAFLDAMAKEKRTVQVIQTMPDDKQSAWQAARVLLAKNSTDFVFSCTQNISDGVVAAIKENRSSRTVQTNSWGLARQEIVNLKSHRVLVSTLFMWDDLAIAIAEGIKSEMEGETVPKLYIPRTLLMSIELDSESLKLMMHKAFRYSVVVF